MLLYNAQCTIAILPPAEQKQDDAGVRDDLRAYCMIRARDGGKIGAIIITRIMTTVV